MAGTRSWVRRWAWACHEYELAAIFASHAPPLAQIHRPLVPLLRSSCREGAEAAGVSPSWRQSSLTREPNSNSPASGDTERRCCRAACLFIILVDHVDM